MHAISVHELANKRTARRALARQKFDQRLASACEAAQQPAGRPVDRRASERLFVCSFGGGGAGGYGCKGCQNKNSRKLHEEERQKERVAKRRKRKRGAAQVCNCLFCNLIAR